MANDTTTSCNWKLNGDWWCFSHFLLLSHPPAHRVTVISEWVFVCVYIVSSCFPGLCRGLWKTHHVMQWAIFSHDFSKSSTASQRGTENRNNDRLKGGWEKSGNYVATEEVRWLQLLQAYEASGLLPEKLKSPPSLLKKGTGWSENLDKHKCGGTSGFTFSGVGRRIIGFVSLSCSHNPS